MRQLTHSASIVHGKRRRDSPQAPLWRDHNLVFASQPASQAGTPWTHPTSARVFKAITRKAGIGENWTRGLRSGPPKFLLTC
jgi:hypothetical protein